MMKNYLLIILLFPFFSYGQTYSYYLHTIDKESSTSYYCSLSSNMTVISQNKSITITDVNKSILSRTDADKKIYETRPKSYSVDLGSCRYVEGTWRGSTYSLGGFSITIPEDVESYHEVKSEYKGSSLYFEKIDSDVSYELHCNVSSLNATNGVTNSDIIHWEYSFLSSPYKVLNNSAGLSEVTFDFNNFDDKSLEEHIGKTIYIRYKLTGGVYSPVRQYEITLCSPTITEFVFTDAKCIYNVDNSLSYGEGSATFHFSDTFNDNRYLIVNLYPYSSVDNDYKPLEKGARIESGNSITFTGLDENKYKIEYWTKIKDGPFSSVGEKTFEISRAKNPIIELTPNNDYCFGAGDGKITSTVSGGTENYTYDWNNGKTTKDLSGLGTGTYTLTVTDSISGCKEKKSTTISVPYYPIRVSNTTSQPTHASAEDGSIEAKISARLFQPSNFYEYKYEYEWYNIDETQENNIKIDSPPSNYSFTIKKEQLKGGTYILKFKETNEMNCTILNSEYELIAPDSLIVTIEETKAISCNNENIHSNPFSDGQLTCTPQGGVPFIDDNGLSYYEYIWKKKIDTDTWDTLTPQTKSIAGLAAGTYKVTVTDKNGIETEVEYKLEQPDLLEINYTKTDIICHNGNNGKITTTISGGTSEYTYTWSNAELTKDLLDLGTGTYTLTVTDEKNCSATKSIDIIKPEAPITIEYTPTPPTFADATDGSIKATISGGTPLTDGSYTFEWKDENDNTLNPNTVADEENFVIKLSNLRKGTYSLTVKDANYDNNISCTYLTKEYKLTDPKPLTATIATHQPISCNSNNIYDDPSSDGKLVCHARGGAPFLSTENNGLPYKYIWKKKTNTDTWEVLTSQTDSITTELAAGTYAVNIEDANGVVLGTYENNVLEEAADVTFLFEEPPLLELSITKQDVFCHLGNDGWAEVAITGGTTFTGDIPYQTVWKDQNISTPLIENISAGTYTVAVSDKNNCQAEESVDITEPQNPLQITYSAFSRPTTNGASDGWIEAQIVGGTPLVDGTYTYRWTDDNGALLNLQTTTSSVGVTNDIFQIRLENIKKGIYFLTIEDANYSKAIKKEHCTIVENNFTIYNPIEAIISVHKPISCNQNNTFDNPSSDGQLLAIVTGGLPFATDQPYIYHWKKLNAMGEYIDLPSQTSPIASNLSSGNYALNVEDALGNVIGVYQNSTLVEHTDVRYTFNDPDLLEVSLSSSKISCDAGDDGSATVGIIGGIRPYIIEWSNGETTKTINSLISGKYSVFITDFRGCKAMGNVTVNQPGGLEIVINDQNDPTCYLGNDGSISVSVTGGELPYTHQWNTGNNTTSISDLSEGTYRFQTTDDNKCSAFIDVQLVDPAPIVVSLGEDRTLCNGQIHSLDLTIDDLGATYEWSIGNNIISSSPNISLATEGTYTAMLTTGLGCVGRDTIKITTSSEDIDSQFLLTSQAFAKEEIMLINTSVPLSSMVDWTVPNQAIIIEESNTNLIYRFDTPGMYEVNMRSYQGKCYQDVAKYIIVEEARDFLDIGDADSPFIMDFKVSPNPTSGEFKVNIILQKETAISLRLFSLVPNTPLNILMDDRQDHGTKEYVSDYNVELVSGIYFLLLETAKGSEIRRIIIE